MKGTYFLKYARRESTTHFVLRDSQQYQWQDIHELLATGVELARPLVLQTTLMDVECKVPYRADFWDTYQVLLPAQAKK